MENSISNSVFKCLKFLRKNPNLLGEKAYYEFLYFFVFKLIEPKLKNNEINLNDIILEYDDNIENFKFNKDILLISKFIKTFDNPEKNGEIYSYFYNYIWDGIFSKHEILGIIFEKKRISYLKENNAILKMCKLVNKIPINENNDILGDIYEQMRTDSPYGAGKDVKKALGQYFTPLNIKKILIDLVNPKIVNNQIESVLDPACGSNGILKTVIKKYMSSPNCPENIKEQIINSIYGIEISNDAYKIGVINIMLIVNALCKNIINNDSIRNFNNIKVDCIIANPPFSAEIDIDDICTEPFYIPINTKTSEFLFLQMMIYCLKINGRCSSILLDGKVLSNISDNNNIIREYILRTCEIHEIINLPGGVFTSTGLKTIIIYFTKRKNPEDVLNSNYNKLNINKIFKDTTFSTTSIKFYSYNKKLTEKTFLKEIPIDKIIQTNFSFAFHDYKDELPKIKGVIYKPLIGTFCTFGATSKLKASDGLNFGKYPFYTSSNELTKFTNNPLIINKESLIIGNGGTANINYDNTFSYTNHAIILHAKKNINLKYVYLYLKNNLHIIQHYFTGCGLQNITKSDIEKIKIPWLSFENQNKIVNDQTNLVNISIKKIEENYKEINFLQNKLIEYLNENIIKHQESESESSDSD